MKPLITSRRIRASLLLLLAILHVQPTESFTSRNVYHYARRHPSTTVDHFKRRHRRSSSSCLSAVKEEANKSQVIADDSTQQEDDSFFGFPQDVASPLALLLFSQFILFIGVGAVIPSIPLYGKTIGLSGKLTGIVISAPAVASFLGSKFAGVYADKARKPAMLIGMAIIIISDIGTALATSLLSLTTARLGLGAGRIISESGERGLLADLAGKVPARRGRALAAQQAVIALGIAIGAPAGGYIVEQYGPRASFLCVSAAAFVCFLLYLFLPETVGSNVNTDTTSDDVTVQQNEQSMGEWSTLITENQWKGLILCQVGASSGFAAKIASIPILAADALPGGAIGAGALLSAAGLSGLVGAPIGGWLTDQTSAKSTAILSGLVSAVGLMLVPFALDSSLSSFWSIDDTTISVAGQNMSGPAAAFSLVVLLWSIGAAAQGPALTALAQELAPAGAEATAMALPRAAGDGTYIVAPFLLGLVSDMSIAQAGTDCAVAGFVGLLGVLALAIFGGDGGGNGKGDTGEATNE